MVRVVSTDDIPGDEMTPDLFGWKVVPSKVELSGDEQDGLEEWLAYQERRKQQRKQKDAKSSKRSSTKDATPSPTGDNERHLCRGKRLI